MDSGIDPVTGQVLFKPAIGRSPHVQRNLDQLPIGDYLYEQGFAAEEKKETLAVSS